MSHINEVLERLYEATNTDGDAHFARKYDIPKTTISNWRQRNSIPWGKIVLIAQQENLSLDSILLGRTAQGNNKQDIQILNYIESTLKSADSEFQIIDQVGVDNIFFDSPPKSESCVMMQIQSNNMEPTINAGDFVVIDSSRNTPEDGIHILNIEGSLKPKRLQKQLDGTLLIKNDNPQYDTEIHKPDSKIPLKIAGRVILRILR